MAQKPFTLFASLLKQIMLKTGNLVPTIFRLLPQTENDNTHGGFQTKQVNI